MTSEQTLCGSKGKECPIYGIECGSDIQRCPVYRAFQVLGRKWTLQILQEFMVNSGVRRFNQIQRSLPWLTPRILSKRLSELQKEGIVERKTFSEQKPIKVEYHLTKKGWELQEAIEKVKEWGKKWETHENQ